MWLLRCLFCWVLWNVFFVLYNTWLLIAHVRENASVSRIIFDALFLGFQTGILVWMLVLWSNQRADKRANDRWAAEFRKRFP